MPHARETGAADITVVRRAAAGEKVAWDCLVDACSPLMWAMLAKFPQLAPTSRENVYQDVWVKLLNGGLRAFAGTNWYAFLGYVRTIVRNAALDALKGERRLWSADPQEAAEETEVTDRLSRIPDLAPGPEAKAQHSETLVAVHKCLQELPLLEQQIVIMLGARDMTYQEITRILALPLGTVASKYNRAKQKLQTCLEQQGMTGIF